MAGIKASLLIPTYNAAKWLPELIEDAHRQTLPFSEIIVYDDCSSDDTVAVAERLGVSVLRGQSNRGAGYSRNRLIEMAKCPWIHFHDADDRMDPDYLASAALALSGEDTVVVCSMQTLDTLTGKIVGAISWEGVNRVEDYVSFVIGTQIAMGVGLYPKHLISKLGGFREDIRGAEDYDFHIRLALNGAKFVAFPNVFTTVRRFGDQTFTEKNREKYLEDFLIVVSDLVPMLNLSQRSVLAVVTVDLAWWFYSFGLPERSKKAQQLALELGAREISTTSKIMALYSRIFGLNAAFYLRNLKNHLSAGVGRVRRLDKFGQ